MTIIAHIDSIVMPPLANTRYKCNTTTSSLYENKRTRQRMQGINHKCSVTYDCFLSVRRSVSFAAMAEWQSKGSARYGTTRLLSQTNCDFIGDNTCISVAVVEATNDKGEKMHYKYTVL